MNAPGQTVRLAIAALLAGAASAASADPLDRLDDALSVSVWQDTVRAHVSGLLDLEGYEFQPPAPGFIRSSGDDLFAPRLALFLDGQAGAHVYFFAQYRVDRGFDPANGPLDGRLDEYAVRLMPGDGRRFSLQAGKFATIVGNWTPRHDSWSNPFVTAPLPYDNLAAVWDAVAARSTMTLLDWAHVRPFPPADADAGKLLRVPLLWGPAYTTGASASGSLGQFEYAVEVKNAPPSSRPDYWSPTETAWEHPAYAARLGWRPDEAWALGLSGSVGPYLNSDAAATVPAGRSFDAYREILAGQDLSYAWHHVQVWAEVYEARFEIPAVTNADTVSYYVETKYKFTPQFFGALRWNQQIYGTVPFGGVPTAWGRDDWRIDIAPAYRFTAHLQGKLQYSIEQGGNVSSHNLGHTLAAQMTLRL